MISSSYRASDHNLQSSDSEENNSDDDVAWQRKSTRFSDQQQQNNSDDDVAWQRKSMRFSDQQQQPLTDNTMDNKNALNIKVKRRKENNIWSAVLRDQSLSDVFGGFNMERKYEFDQDRHCESYDYRRKMFDTRPEVPYTETESLVETIDSKEVFGVKTNEPVKAPVFKKRWRPSPEEKQTARLIIRKLNEKKQELIYNVVKVLGIPKAMDLLSITENIEDNGGMMTLNGSRRRTPGGVFFQLIKSDRNITKAQHNEIFTENRQPNKKVPNKKKKHQCEVTTMEIDEKLPSAAEHFLSKCNSTGDSNMVEANGTVDAEAEEGEIFD